MASDSTPARGPNTRAGAPGEVLRILVIDENPRDRALIAESLRNGLPESEVVEVQDPSELSGGRGADRHRRHPRGPPPELDRRLPGARPRPRAPPGPARHPLHGHGQRGARRRGDEGGLQRLRPQAPPPLPAARLVDPLGARGRHAPAHRARGRDPLPHALRGRARGPLPIDADRPGPRRQPGAAAHARLSRRARS